jgi:hypothetical protein
MRIAEVFAVLGNFPGKCPRFNSIVNEMDRRSPIWGKFPGKCPWYNPIVDAQLENGNIPWKMSEISSATVVNNH